MKKWKVLARHTWVAGCTITESEDITQTDIAYRRMTATIRGWRNFVIYEGDIAKISSEKIRDKVMEIRDRIDNGDQEIFEVDSKIHA